MPRVRSVRRNSRSVRRNRSSRRSRTVRGGARNPSFAAQLGAFLLEGAKGNIEFSFDGGFSEKVPEVFGVLPYLHMNVSKNTFRSHLADSRNNRVSALSKVCRSKNLDNKLSAVDFSCRKQPQQGVLALDNAIVDSIVNGWNSRSNGRKYLLQVLKYQREQAERGLIPKASVEWGKGL